MKRGPFTFTRDRVIQVAVIVVLCLLGAFLPYLTLGYQDFASSRSPDPYLVRRRRHVGGWTDLSARGRRLSQDVLQRGVDVIHLGRAQESA
jgi:hypothetical protein